MENTIYISNLNGKSKLRFYTENNSIDFSNGSTPILIYFDDNSTPGIDAFAALHIIQNNQSQTGVFEFDIQANSSKAKIVVSSNIHDVNLIKVIAL